MKIGLYSEEPATLAVELLALPVPQGALAQCWALPLLPDELQAALLRNAEQEGFVGKERETLLLHPVSASGPRRVALIGLGPATPLGPTVLRGLAAVTIRLAQSLRCASVALALPELPEAELAAGAQRLVEGAELAAYRFERYRTEKKPGQVDELRLVVSPRTATLAAAAALEPALARGRLLAGCVGWARDRVNEPGAVLTPQELAEQARLLASEAGLALRVLGRRDCEELGMGLLLGVARGSENEPQLIQLSYVPAGAAPGTRRVALVGKGVTFDSGGLNIKVGKGMEEMKCDMAGGAAVLATMRAVAELRPDCIVHALVPAVENMPSGRALRPGDILTALDGTTVEVLNTDAEGRLILADAIAFALTLPVDEIIELSTLTGACVVALGPRFAGLLSDDDALAERLLVAARAVGESLWRLPLDPELNHDLDSDVADRKNIGGKDGGAIQGGLFLRPFAKSIPFAHLDIAGPAMADKEGAWWPKGGTGYGVLTLVEYLTGRTGQG